MHGTALACLFIAALASTPSIAQRDDVRKMNVMLARNETSMTVGRVRYDLVGRDHPDLEDPGTLLLRVARKAPEGWAVRVYTGQDGRLVMTGTFADDSLTVAHGEFTFYHPNGQVESTGRFEQGVKAGTWHRYDPQGNALPDRIYGHSTVRMDPVQECRSTLSCKP